jgi:hypothetical protein
MRTREIAQARVRYGYRKIRVLLNREGWEVGKYLAYRLYTEEGVTLKRMKPARVCSLGFTIVNLRVFLSAATVQRDAIPRNVIWCQQASLTCRF